jgi:hypothetical protein
VAERSPRGRRLPLALDGGPLTQMNRTLRPTVVTADRAPVRGVAVRRSTSKHHGIRLIWGRLDRLRSVATLGLVLVDPRSALLVARLLGPRSRVDLDLCQPPSAGTPRQG